jgi:hypothetical protein
MKNCRPVFTSGILIIFFFLSVYSNELEIPGFDVPLSHPVYRFIEALNLPAITEGISISQQPFTEQQISKLLAYALCNIRKIDSVQVIRFLDEIKNNSANTKFVLQLGDSINTAYCYPYIKTICTVQDSHFTVKGYENTQIDSLSRNKEFDNKSALGIVLRTNFFNIPIFFNGAILTEYSTLQSWKKVNDPRTGKNLTTIFAEKGKAGHFIGYDGFSTYFKIPNRFVDLKIGQDVTSWGYSKGMGLVLSGENNPYFNIQAHKKLGKIDYTFIWGKLIADTYSQKKLMYSKRIVFQPNPVFAAGFSDQVITIQRSFEPLYLLPFVPYFFLEHYIGDLDNRLMSFDLYLNIRNFISIYGELGMDDISNLAGIFTNKDANDKWEVMAGIKCANLLPRIMSSTKIEYVQIEPWVYTTSAKDNNEVFNYPIHFGQTLGNSYGPHSRAIKASLDLFFSSKLSTNISILRLWKGKGMGSSSFDINPYVTDTIDGEISKHQKYQTKEYRFEEYSRNRICFLTELFYRPFRWWEINGGINLAYEKIPDSEVYLNTFIETRFNY